MSALLEEYVWRLEDCLRRPKLKYILIALAHFANDEGEGTFCIKHFVKKLAFKDVEESQFHQIMRDLFQEEFILRLESYYDVDGKILNYYKLNVNKLKELAID